MLFRVLAADDDEWTRHLLRSYLTGEGVEVETVRNGEEAIARFCQTRPDIVILDLEMPRSTGLDVLDVIRGQSADTAVVITTAYGSEETAVAALRRGADDYLRKPFERSDLRVVLDRTMARLLLTRQNEALRARLAAHQRHIEDEIARAAAVVAGLLPDRPRGVAGIDVAAACLSARELGGDFYDWQPLPGGRFSVTVGDVMGKGLSAALLMATTRAVLRAVAADHPPSAAVQLTAAALEDDLARSGSFVTLFHGQIDTTTGELRYVDAGHGYVLLRRVDGGVEELQPWALPLGVDARERYREGCVRLDPGDVLLVYSDGLVEARPDRFATRSDVAAAVSAGADAEAIIAAFMAEVRDIRPLPDDLTLLTLRRVSEVGRGREHPGARPLHQ